MVVRIERSTPGCGAALSYNERKVEEGVACVVDSANVPSLERSDLEEMFDRIARGRLSSSNVSFHASVNPSETDTCSEEQVLVFIRELMGTLGLGGQPYVVYRHDDIGRPHYHVVSTRIGPDGRRIDAWKERERAQEAMRRLGPELGFVPGRSRAVEQVETLAPESGVHPAPSRFSPGGDVVHQLRAILGHCLTYSFTTEQQFILLMQDLGVGMFHGWVDGRRQFLFQGMDAEGRPLTGILSEGDLGVDTTSMLSQALSAGKRTHRIRTRELSRVENLVRSCQEHARSEQHLVNMLGKAGISMHVSRTEAGEAFGLTFIDHRTRTAFKGSELHGALTVAMMKQAVEEGRWRESDRGQEQGRTHVRSSRKVASLLRRSMLSASVGLGGGASAGSAGRPPRQEDARVSQDVADENVADRNVADSNIASL